MITNQEMFEQYLENAPEIDQNIVVSQIGIKKTYLEKSENEDSLSKKFVALKNIKLQRWNDRSKKLFCEVFIHYLNFSNVSYKNFNQSEHSQKLSEIIMEDFGLLINMDKLQCIKIWLALYEPLQKNGERKFWEAEEEELIRRFSHQQYPKSSSIDEKLVDWNLLAFNFNILSKGALFTSAKQLREHFVNSMRPDITKESFQPSEDLRIMKEILLRGKKWNSIAAVLQNRQCNQVKNRYFQILKKVVPIRKLRKFTKSQEKQLCVQIYKKLSEGLSIDDEQLDLSSYFKIDQSFSTLDEMAEEKIFLNDQEINKEIFEIQNYETTYPSYSRSYSPLLEISEGDKYIDEYLNSFPVNENEPLLY